jgi:hypothetical protein
MGKYSLLGQVIEFKDCNERFFDIQYRVWNAMDAASSEFNQWYDNCGDILTVLKGYEDIAGALIIRKANEPLFQELPQLGIYDLSEDRYDDDCLIIDESIKAFDVVADAYNSIIEQQAAEEEYRAERKANRGRVVGGGFGVDLPELNYNFRSFPGVNANSSSVAPPNQKTRTSVSFFVAKYRLLLFGYHSLRVRL